MAAVAKKSEGNGEGTSYAYDQVIAFDHGNAAAHESFKRNDEGGHVLVDKQAETTEEEELCKEAMEGCPVEAIGNDGG